jgi:chromosome condensin MukBEF ATPase and DNA-binding subunit MukB
VDRLEADKKEVSASLDKKREELEELMRAMKTETSTETQLKEANAELDHAKSKMADYKKGLDDVNQKYQVELKN